MGSKTIVLLKRILTLTMQVEENMRVNENCEDKKDTSNINEFPTKLDKILNKIIMKEGFLTYDIYKKSISTNGGNYLGILFEIDIKGETNKGVKETYLFVKTMAPGEDKMKILSIPRAYKTEMFAYKELCQVFIQIQDEANIPLNGRFKMVKSYDECNPEAIILENVAKKSYKTHYRKDIVSFTYAKLAIQQLARLHGLSFAIQEKKPEYFDSKIKTLQHAFNFGTEWNQFMKSMCVLTMNYLDQDMKNQMENVFPNLLNKYAEYIGDKSTRICLCHGDYRPNNIMMKEINGELTDLIPIDYQLLHYGSPIYDFLYFIYTSTDKKFRNAHLSKLKDVYYDSLGKFLEYFDMSVESIYPREDFEMSLREKLDFGLMVTIIFGPFMFVDEDDVPDVTKESMADISFNLDDRYKDVLREVIEDFIEWGYL